MPSNSHDSEFANALQELLLVPLPEVPQAPQFILTTAPHLWSTLGIGEGSLLVDLSSLIGGSSAWAEMAASPFESQLELIVYNAFLAAGWPESMIRLQFRPDEKAHFCIDLAICDVAGQIVAAVEIKGSHGIGRLNEPVVERLLSIPTVRWACVTDSQTYMLIGRDGQHHESSAVPSPIELGIDATPALASRRGLTNSVLRPSSAEAMGSLFAEHSPTSVIVDFTVPWGHRLESGSVLFDLLPDNLRQQAPGRAELIDVLLASVTTYDSVKQISAVTPPAIAWTESSKWVRQTLTDRLGLAAHIELPVSSWAHSTLLRGSFLLFGGQREKAYFDVLATPAELIRRDAASWFNGFTGWLAGKPLLRGYTKKDVAAVNWSYAANDPQAEQTREHLANLGPTLRFGDIAEVFLAPSPKMLGSVQDTDAEGDAIRILDNQYLHTGDEEHIQYLTPDDRFQERYRLIKGDILVPSIFRSSTKVRLFAGGISAVAGSNVIVVRLGSDDLSPQYVAEFLNSSVAKRLLDLVASSIGSQVHRASRITVNDLRNLAVPNVPLDMGELDKVEQLRGQLVNATEELEARRFGLFDSRDKNEFRKNLDDLRSKAQLLAEAIRLSESLDFQISNFFPFPLGYGYRLLASYVDPRARYQEQLRFAENMLAFLGSVSIAMLTSEDRTVLTTDLRKEWRGGISPGGWKDLTNKCCRLLTNHTGNLLADRICALKVASEKKGTFGERVKLLIERKNDFKHDRGPKADADVVTHSQEIQKCLDGCMETLTFLMRHPIRQVRDNDPIRRQPGRTRLSCLRVVGDHPGFRQEQIDWHQPLTKGDLYLEVNEGHWISLFPFVRILTCPRCKVDEIYFVDKWDGEAATMKSFERGHTESCSETGRELDDLLRVET